MFNPDLNHRRSIRLADYDYADAGAYFVTVCSWQRECLFGEITDGAMMLNGFGEIVQEEWLRSAAIRNEITLDEFIVMPNHIHGIIFIDVHVGADGVRPGSGHEGARRAPLRGPKSLGSFVAGFKSAVTKRINQILDNHGCPVWQRNYYERVIRNDRELAAIREYIVSNPTKWAMDEENPANQIHMKGRTAVRPKEQ